MIHPFNYIVQKMDDVHLVWLPQVNKYLQFQEPAWKVFARLAENIDRESIVSFICSSYGLESEAARDFINDIANNVDQVLCNKESFEYLESPVLLNQNKHNFQVKYYRVGKKIIKVKFPNSFIFDSVHPFVSHLETTDQTISGTIFTFVQVKDHFGLFKNMELVFSGSESMYLIGKFYQYLLSEIHSVKSENWMSVCHASAVANGESSLMVSGPSGSGKSTMTGLLAAHGFSFVADDFVAIDSTNFAAYPFPTALSVKHGSVKLLSNWYEDLPQKEVQTNLRVDKEIRLLPLFAEEDDFYSRIFPVKHLIFLEYKEGSEFQIEKLTASASLKLFFEQTWVSSDPKNIRQFMRWYKQLNCYQMTYSDHNRAIEFFLELMNVEV